jgi:hypothetical protein
MMTVPHMTCFDQLRTPWHQRFSTRYMHTSCKPHLQYRKRQQTKRGIPSRRSSSKAVLRLPGGPWTRGSTLAVRASLHVGRIRADTRQPLPENGRERATLFLGSKVRKVIGVDVASRTWRLRGVSHGMKPKLTASAVR